MSNYPDDIHTWDWHPRSPFYVEPEYVCEGCKQAFTADEMATETYCTECIEND